MLVLIELLRFESSNRIRQNANTNRIKIELLNVEYIKREREFFQFDVNSFMVTLKSANVHPNGNNWREHIRSGHENTATLDRPENIKIVEAVNNGLVFGANNRHKNMNHRFELCILTNWNDSSLISISREGCANVYYNICAHIKTNQAIVF